MRRILLLNTDLEQGGTPNVIRELAVRLTRSTNAHIEVACLSKWGPVADPISAEGICVTPLNARGVLDLGVAQRLHGLIRAHQIDTVFSFLVHANAMAAVVSLGLRDVRFIQAIQTTQPRPSWHWPVQAAAQYAAEKIVAPSQSVADVARDRAGVPLEKIVVIPNAIDGANVKRDRAARATSDGPEDFRIGFLGRLDPVKRIDDLVSAMALVRTGTLHIFGAGEERNRLEDLIAHLGLAPRVHLRGPTRTANEALEQMDLLVLPSEAEGFPLVLIEAMAAHVPIVATDAPGIRDVVCNGQTGILVPVGSPAHLAAAIQALVDDRERREQLANAGCEDVLRRFTWDRVLPQYTELLGIA